MGKKKETVKIDPKYLKGLFYHDHIAKETIKEGRRRIEYEKIQRPLEVEDILSWKEYLEEIVFVTKDGRKYRFPKKEGDQ